MNYEQEKKMHISFCGSYCHQCDWHTGRIRRTAQQALDMLREYDGFKRLLEGNVNIDNMMKGLELLAGSSICSGCKAETRPSARCEIRTCCSTRGYDLCSECEDFPCETLKTNPGVVKFHCIENLKAMAEIGIEKWIDEQWVRDSKIIHD